MVNRSLNVTTLKKEPGATAVLKDFKDHTDPTYIGPGTWNVIHRQAWLARSTKAQKDFIEFMKEVCYNFPCTVCRGHCSEYIKNHPMEEYINISIEIEGKKLLLGLFIWTWKFHNAVNIRLKKPIMSWDTAYNLYLGGSKEDQNGVCSKTCLGAEDNKKSENKNNLRIHRIINKR